MSKENDKKTIHDELEQLAVRQNLKTSQGRIIFHAVQAIREQIAQENPEESKVIDALNTLGNNLTIVVMNATMRDFDIILDEGIGDMLLDEGDADLELFDGTSFIHLDTNFNKRLGDEK